MSPNYEGIEPQFDLAAQEIAAAGLADKGIPGIPVFYVYDRAAVIAAAQARAAEIQREWTEAAEAFDNYRTRNAETAVPESEPIQQEPELAGEPAVAPPDPNAPAPPPPTQADLPGGTGG